MTIFTGKSEMRLLVIATIPSGSNERTTSNFANGADDIVTGNSMNRAVI
uniref:Uncharacterized protein n=1 Tax=Escherichia coli TaxID=562 RepID=A0A1S7BFH6_ECOLX|nr:hypothetical protein [Escherichia coli]AQX82593.1 hypothetical protein [Escherichia coli]